MGKERGHHVKGADQEDEDRQVLQNEILLIIAQLGLLPFLLESYAPTERSTMMLQLLARYTHSLERSGDEDLI